MKTGALMSFTSTCCQACVVEANIRLGSWDDVRQKALGLRQTGGISIDTHEPLHTFATVQGEHGAYVVRLYRASEQDPSIVTWSCSCPWGYWAWRRQHQYVGRTCSHALAVFYESRSLEESWSAPIEYQVSPQSQGYE